MWGYFRRKKARKELLALRGELSFYDPLYQAVSPFYAWVTEKWKQVHSNQIDLLGREKEYSTEIYPRLPLQLTVFKQIIAEYGGSADTAYFEETIEYVEKILAELDAQQLFMLMFHYQQMFERAEWCHYLKKRAAELQKLI